jgi:hypothetical protein
MKKNPLNMSRITGGLRVLAMPVRELHVWSPSKLYKGTRSRLQQQGGKGMDAED